MPRRFNRRSRFRRNRRPRFRRRRARMRRRRRVVLDPERKDRTLEVVSTDINNTTGLFVQLSNIDQGITSSDRIGRQCILVSFHASMQITGGPTLVNGIVVRILLVLDKTPAGVQWTLPDLFDSPGIAFVSSRNLSLTRRLSILWSRTVRFDAALPSRLVRINKRFRIPVRYQGTGGGITDIESNGLTLLFVSNQGLVAESPLVTAHLRTRFVG